eukprot:TRINITY_DN107_c0_g7_i1.p1 TRINITY_DN107_c0_g7~~TRINITY_DN107_c0_g7_i1.p1  ORF type:complete len:305 (-),score=26.30 TRINITY_DN107_c0_g7_i1:229-1143(-)
MKKLFTLIALVSVCLAVQAKKYDLGLNLEIGKEYHQKTTANMNIKQSINGMDMDMTMKVTADMAYKVIAKEGDNFNMDVTYKSLGMEMGTMQGNMSFSSENAKPEDIMSTMLSKLANSPFQVKMTRKGIIVEVKGLEALLGNLFEGMDVNEMQKAQLAAQMEKSYGEEALKQNLEMATAIFPEENVAIGDTWTKKGKIESNMSVNVSTTYQLKEAAADFYLIHGDSQLDNDADAPFMNQNGMDMRVEMNGKMISDIKVDKNSGWIKEVKIKQDLKGNTFVKGNAQIPDGMNIPMEITGETTVVN